MTKLPEFLSELEELTPEERLHWLIEFGESLPALLPEEATRISAGDCRVQECQTPVDLWVEVRNGRVHLAAHVPEKSPTVRGLLAMLVVGLEGSTPEEISKLSDDLPLELGLQAVLGMTRSRGFRGIVARIKREVVLRK